MTSPVTPLHKQGDSIFMNGVQTTVLSWPALNVGPFMWEQYNPYTQGFTRGTSYVEQLATTATDPTAAVAEDPADFENDQDQIDTTGEDNA